MRLWTKITATLMGMGFCAGAAGSEPRVVVNVLPNPSFEEAQPRGWQTHTWGGQGQFDYATSGRTGGRSLMIASEHGVDAAWHATVAVEPYSKYRLSGWIKTQDVRGKGGQGAMLNVHGLESARTPAVTGTNDWGRVEVEFDTGRHDQAQVNCVLGGWGSAAGRAWFDDVTLEWVSMGAVAPAVTIDAAKTGEPISKYIYGQFIEHLGRCIYGGIWAEMLEDRKFLHAVGSPESPWKAVGGDGVVEMVREGCFVGDHAPQVRSAGEGPPRGLAQGGLGVRQGRDYAGRIVLAGDPEAAPVDVALIWGPGPHNRLTVTIEHLRPEYTTSPLRFSAGADMDDARLEIVARGRGAFRVGTVSLMPADNVHGMRADTLKLLKELDAPIYRWPGGNFVSGYNWKDAIGDRDRRPPRRNPAWQGIEHHDFGLDEFMVFCRELNTEPYVVVNSGQGDARLAADEVEYANGGPDTPMGRLRAAHGHPEPYRVRWWGIGNEMYGNWQLGHMPLDQYVVKHNQFAEAMRAVDPTIKLIAVGSVGEWSERMLTRCAGHMDLLSEHFYTGELPGLQAHVRQMPDHVRRIAEAHRQYRRSLPSLAGKDIRIALDEWNYWYGGHVFGELGTRYFLRDALGIAAGLHEYARHSDLYFMANYAQTVNVIGAMKTSKTEAALETTGLVLKLYRQRFGVVPVAVSGEPAPLDVAAAWTQDRKTLTLGVVNPLRGAVGLALTVQGASLTGEGRWWIITGPDEIAYNEPGQPSRVGIGERAVTGISDRLELPPLSVSVLALTVR